MGFSDFHHPGFTLSIGNHHPGRVVISGDAVLPPPGFVSVSHSWGKGIENSPEFTTLSGWQKERRGEGRAMP